MIFESWGEWPFIFGELGSTGNYFQGAGEQALNFGDLRPLSESDFLVFVCVGGGGGGGLRLRFLDPLYISVLPLELLQSIF